MNRTFLLLVFNLLIRVSFLQSQEHRTEPISSNDSLAAVKQSDSLFQVARSLISKRDFIKALEVNTISEKIALEKLGRISGAYGACCHLRGLVNYLIANYSEAEKWYTEAIEIRKKVLGKDNRDYAGSLSNLGLLYSELRNFEKAEPLYLEATSIRMKIVGNEHPEYAASLNNLANLYRDMGNFDEAEPLYIEAKAIRMKALGTEHPDFAQSLNSLAILYSLMGYYEQAESLYLKSQVIIEKVLGKNHPDFAQSLNNLAILNMDLGKFEKSEQLYLEALNSRKIIFGKENPAYAESVLNVANLYIKMGNYEKAELYYFEASSIFKEIFGKEHPNYATSLNNLANLNWSIGRFSRAETFYLDSKNIRENSLGTNHPDYAQSLNNLANLYRDMGDFVQAEKYYLESKAIWEKVYGKEHPDYAQSLSNMAILYMSSGNYEKAEPLFLEGKAIREKTLGKEHPDYMKSVNNLAELFQKQSRFLEAEPLFEEGFTLVQKRLANAASFLSEQELSKYVADYHGSYNNLNTFLYLREEREAQTGLLPTLAFDNALFYKGFLLSSASKLNSPIRASPESSEINLRLKGYRRRLAAEYAKPIDERKGISELEDKANLAEKELARAVAGYADAIRQVKWENVKVGLKPSEVAVEFIAFKVNFPQKTDSTMYAALFLEYGSKQPRIIPLFEERQLTQLLTNNKESNLITSLYASRGVVPIKEVSLGGLYDLIWKPMESILKDVKTVYYSPSGLLHRFNFDAIPIDEKTNLSDKFKLVRLGSTRSLVVPDLTKIDSSNNAILFGGINYNIDTALNNSDTFIHGVLASKDEELSFSYSDRGIKERGIDWGFLPGTKKEIHGVSKLFQKSKFNSTAFTGNSATEESFKSIGRDKISPRVLHIATHGFFFPDPKSYSHESSFSSQTESVFKMSDHPMIRSGLILAGGNYAWINGRPIVQGGEDGILTAYEISQMNLSNTELVVLSACETGLGDIQGNEGVYGLQRAFKIAGAKYLIMSLWQVPDKQTSLLMTTFYKKWLENKMTIPDAFHAAQKELRDIGLDPYQWAGFVLVE